MNLFLQMYLVLHFILHFILPMLALAYIIWSTTATRDDMYTDDTTVIWANSYTFIEKFFVFVTLSVYLVGFMVLMVIRALNKNLVLHFILSIAAYMIGARVGNGPVTAETDTASDSVAGVHIDSAAGDVIIDATAGDE